VLTYSEVTANLDSELTPVPEPRIASKFESPGQRVDLVQSPMPLGVCPLQGKASSGVLLVRVVPQPGINALFGDSNHDVTGRFDAGLTTESRTRSHVKYTIEAVFFNFTGRRKQFLTVLDPHVT